jgi:hypothetical protein
MWRAGPWRGIKAVLPHEAAKAAVYKPKRGC